MDVEDFDKLQSLAKSPELFEKKRQRLINSFISSATSKEEQAQLRAIQKELDSSRDQSSFQIALANSLLEQVKLKSGLLKKTVAVFLEQEPDGKSPSLVSKE